MTKVNPLIFLSVLIFTNLSPAVQKNRNAASQPRENAKTVSAKAQQLQLSVSKILQQHNVKPAEVSLLIEKNQDEGQEVYADINSKKMLIPASISKLATAYAVYRSIPYDHKFRTQLCYDSKNKNLYLVGGGDPGFVSENMWFLVNEFTRKEIKTIEGDIIVDDYIFDDIRYDESRESVRVDRSYDAPVGGMSFNWNSVNIFVSPDVQSKKIKVFVDPESEYFSLKNLITVAAKNNVNSVHINVDQKKRLITVSGSVSLNMPEKAYYKNVADPVSWAGINLKSFLKQRGITVKGQVKRGKLNSSAVCAAKSESKNLSALVSDMNKFSNNYVAEMLTKNIAALNGENPATLKGGVKVINDELKLLGLTGQNIFLQNPSGLTRDNKMSAYSVNVILNKVKDDFKIYSAFAESLPYAGYDGTLKRRLKESKTQGYVKAKTGYLTGVVSLAGYAGDDQGHIYTFTFIYNGKRNEADVRRMFDQILTQLLD